MATAMPPVQVHPKEECSLLEIQKLLAAPDFMSSDAKFVIYVNGKWASSQGVKAFMPALVPVIQKAMREAEDNKADVINCQQQLIPPSEVLKDVRHYELQTMVAQLMDFRKLLDGETGARTKVEVIPGWFPWFDVPSKCKIAGRVPSPEEYRAHKYRGRMQLLNQHELCLVIGAILDLYRGDQPKLENLERLITRYLDEVSSSLLLPTAMRGYFAALKGGQPTSPSGSSENGSAESKDLEASFAEFSDIEVDEALAGAQGHYPLPWDSYLEAPMAGFGDARLFYEPERADQLDTDDGSDDAQPPADGYLCHNEEKWWGEESDEAGEIDEMEEEKGDGESEAEAGDEESEEGEEDEDESDEDGGDDMDSDDKSSDDGGDDDDTPPASGSGGASGGGQNNGPDAEDQRPGNGGGSGGSEGSNPVSEMQKWADWDGTWDLTRGPVGLSSSDDVSGTQAAYADVIEAEFSGLTIAGAADASPPPPRAADVHDTQSPQAAVADVSGTTPANRRHSLPPMLQARRGPEPRPTVADVSDARAFDDDVSEAASPWSAVTGASLARPPPPVAADVLGTDSPPRATAADVSDTPTSTPPHSQAPGVQAPPPQASPDVPGGHDRPNGRRTRFSFFKKLKTIFGKRTDGRDAGGNAAARRASADLSANSRAASQVPAVTPVLHEGEPLLGTSGAREEARPPLVSQETSGLRVGESTNERPRTSASETRGEGRPSELSDTVQSGMACVSLSSTALAAEPLIWPDAAADGLAKPFASLEGECLLSTGAREEARASLVSQTLSFGLQIGRTTIGRPRTSAQWALSNFYDDMPTRMPYQLSWSSRALRSWKPKEGALRSWKPKEGVRVFKFQDLEAAADGFSPAKLLGEGAFGKVYLGRLEGTAVAVKVLASGGLQQSDVLGAFQREVDILSRFGHPNILMLVGCCLERPCLIVEYCENGSLQDHLRKKSNSPPLPWFTRVRIACEVGLALQTMHTASPSIIHKDLKPSNILLDKRLVAKLGDVGISRLARPDVATAASMTFGGPLESLFDSRPQGTVLYMDPEYLSLGTFSQKSDVYAFGLILLQLLTNLPPFGIVGKVKKATREGRIMEILDAEAGEWSENVAAKVAELGLKCTEILRRERANLDEVLPALQSLRDDATKAVGSEGLDKADDVWIKPTCSGSSCQQGGKTLLLPSSVAI